MNYRTKDNFTTLEDYKDFLRKIYSDDIIAIYFDLIARCRNTEIYDDDIRDYFINTDVDVCWNPNNCNSNSMCTACANDFITSMKAFVLKQVKEKVYNVYENEIETVYEMSKSNSHQTKDYWYNINKIAEHQKEKGFKTYGMRLEDNNSMNVIKRIEYLQEELIDGLNYCEWIKDAIMKGELK